MKEDITQALTEIGVTVAWIAGSVTWYYLLGAIFDRTHWDWLPTMFWLGMATLIIIYALAANRVNSHQSVRFPIHQALIAPQVRTW